MVKAKKYQFLAIAILVIASLSTFVAFIYDDAFCVTGYGVEGITYLNTISSASDEPVLFVFAGIIGLFFAMLLSFTKTKFWFFAVNMVMLMCMAIPMSMFSAAPFYQVIYESIFLCGHRVLLSTVLIFYLYWGAVAIYLLKLDKT
ncbi:hypothetical protein BEN71_07150 [Acinetobacter wuhouensis]|uniref:hypothetical protein n=1 Tax=Acinetobacter wuhouensis TaxID=1879050 RepID=UPI00083A5A9C|nr:hypothetical protein [Acinetobacter wuhouensis]AXQ21852.1 hypothetical protein BEN71_07150 [Acinetobacter wuhouensis]